MAGTGIGAVALEDGGSGERKGSLGGNGVEDISKKLLTSIRNGSGIQSEHLDLFFLNQVY